MFFISGLPHNRYLFYGDVTRFIVAVLQVKYSFLDLQDFTAQARSATAVDVNLFAQHLG